ncbi:cAMP-specific 3',5'-cyclic phosphodiesterase 4B, partial [Chaetura pelagica]
SRTSVAFLSWQNALDYLECGLSKSYSTSSHALGIDLWRGRRCCSGNLQLPPLSQRQTEKARTPDRD